MKTIKVLTTIGAILLLTHESSAISITYGFVNITHNNAADEATGSQYTVEVSDNAGAGQVQFVFRNSGPAASSITDVYFDDGTLLGIANVINGTGVDFSQGASPGDPPGGNTVGFVTTAGFSADSNPPTQVNGVNPGEMLTIVFDLTNGKTVQDTILALNGGQDLRIGIHVQGFEGGGSESFITRVPDGGTTAVLLGLGILGLASIRRRGL